ncbi:MAG: DNA/RNA nuclease SfsA [Oscillospiraceae bacterium]|nr:DNA/RNA nuclease SfsA [Oscillospiraceae bacterium]
MKYFYIEDSGTIIEIKSIIATEYEAAFPTVYSERTVNQLRKIQELLMAGRKACFLAVSLHHHLRKTVIAEDTDFHKELRVCMANGMIIRAYTLRLTERGLIIEHQIPIEIL